MTNEHYYYSYLCLFVLEVQIYLNMSLVYSLFCFSVSIQHIKQFQIVISNSVRSWIYLVPLIPSIFVTIFDLYYFLSSRALCTAINNHVIILLRFLDLISKLTDFVWNIHYYRTGTALSSTSTFCLAWLFIDTTLFTSISILMAWAPIERHVIIFYPHLLAAKTKRFFFICSLHFTAVYTNDHLCCLCKRSAIFRSSDQLLC